VSIGNYLLQVVLIHPMNQYGLRRKRNLGQGVWFIYIRENTGSVKSVRIGRCVRISTRPHQKHNLTIKLVKTDCSDINLLWYDGTSANSKPVALQGAPRAGGQAGRQAGRYCLSAQEWPCVYLLQSVLLSSSERLRRFTGYGAHVFQFCLQFVFHTRVW